jgi:hypothetical protein
VEIARTLLDRCNEAEVWGLTCFLIDQHLSELCSTTDVLLLEERGAEKSRGWSEIGQSEAPYEPYGESLCF